MGHFSLDKLALGPNICLKISDNLQPKQTCDDVATIPENCQDSVFRCLSLAC